uniref:Uncharacterized protein n=1 Tax=Cucumis melo TaxID=3656 RepID=A0A9I9E3V6_CUCME
LSFVTVVGRQRAIIRDCPIRAAKTRPGSKLTRPETASSP